MNLNTDLNTSTWVGWAQALWSDPENTIKGTVKNNMSKSIDVAYYCSTTILKQTKYGLEHSPLLDKTKDLLKSISDDLKGTDNISKLLDLFWELMTKHSLKKCYQSLMDKGFEKTGFLMELTRLRKADQVNTPNLNKLMIELQNYLANAETREMVEIIVAFFDLLASDPELQEKIQESAKSLNAEKVIHELLVPFNDTMHNREKVKHFHVAIEAILTYDIWDRMKHLHLSKIKANGGESHPQLPEEIPTTFSRFKAIIAIISNTLKEYKPDPNNPVDENWTANNSKEKINEIGDNIKEMIHDLMATKVLEHLVKYLPYDRLKQMIPAATPPFIQQIVKFFLTILESKNENIELQFLITPLASVILDGEVQGFVQKHRELDFSALTDEISQVSRGFSAPTPLLAELGRDFSTLMRNAESRRSISELAQTLQMIFTYHKYENYASQVESNIKTQEARELLAEILSHITEWDKDPKDFLANAVTPFLVENLWNCFAKADSVGEFAKMGNQLTNWMIHFSPGEESESALEASQIKLKNEILTISSFAGNGIRAFGLEIAFRASQQGLIENTFQKIPNEAVLLANKVLMKVELSVTDPNYKSILSLLNKGLKLLYMIQVNDHQPRATDLISPLAKISLNESIQKTFKQSQTCSIDEMLTEGMKLKNEVDVFTTQLNKLAQIWDPILANPDTNHAIGDFLTTLQALIDDKTLHQVIEKLKDTELKGFYGALIYQLISSVKLEMPPKAIPYIDQIIEQLASGDLLPHSEIGPRLSKIIDYLDEIIQSYKSGKGTLDSSWSLHRSPIAKARTVKIINELYEIVQSSNKLIKRLVASAPHCSEPLLASQHQLTLRDGAQGYEGCIELSKVSRVFTVQYVAHMMEHSPEWNENLNNNFWGKTIRLVFADEQEQVGKTIETAYLKALSTLKVRLTKAQEKSDFMGTLAVDILKDFHQHLLKYNKATDNGLLSPSQDDLLLEFQNTDLGQYPLDNEKGMGHRTALGSNPGVFKRVGDKLLSKIFPNGMDDLEIAAPLPREAREWIWQQLKDIVIPNSFGAIFGEAISSQRIDLMLFNMLSEISTAIFPAVASEPKPQSATTKVSEKVRQELKEASGAVTEELLKRYSWIISSTISKNMAGEALSNSISNLIDSWDFNKIIEIALETGLPKWHQARWEMKDGKLSCLIPQETNAEGQTVDTTQFNFKWPITEAEKSAEIEAKKILATETTEKLEQLLDQIFDKSVREAAFYVVKSLIKAFFEVISKFMLVGFIFEDIFDFLFDALADLITRAISLPFNILLYLFDYFWQMALHQVSLTTRSALNNPIHEAFFTQATERLIDEI